LHSVLDVTLPVTSPPPSSAIVSVPVFGLPASATKDVIVPACSLPSLTPSPSESALCGSSPALNSPRLLRPSRSWSRLVCFTLSDRL